MGPHGNYYDPFEAAWEREERKHQKRLLERKRMRDGWKFVSPKNKKRGLR